MIEIRHRCSGKVVFSADVQSIILAVEAAINARADLSGADLSNTNLSNTNLSWADLSWADLSNTDLSNTNLSNTNLSWADLSNTNLSNTNLSNTNLSWADLSGADLSGADLDFSSGLSFRCSSFRFKADLRLAAQLAYHFCRIDFVDCADAKKAQEAIKGLANRFHRVGECGRIE